MKTDIILQEMADMGSNYRYRQFYNTCGCRFKYRIAKEEGIIFDLLTNPTEILSDENGWVSGIKCVRMELGEPDASGRRRPVVIEGSEFLMEIGRASCRERV